MNESGSAFICSDTIMCFFFRLCSGRFSAATFHRTQKTPYSGFKTPVVRLQVPQKVTWSGVLASTAHSAVFLIDNELARWFIQRLITHHFLSNIRHSKRFWSISPAASSPAFGSSSPHFTITGKEMGKKEAKEQK